MEYVFWFFGLWFVWSGSASDEEFDKLTKNQRLVFDPRPILLFVGLAFVIYAWLKTKYGV